MVRSSIAFAALASIASVYAQATCSLDSHCPEDTPCCSQYGQCGVGAYCLGGCDPRSSYSLDSCVPEPVCESKTYTFTSMDRITSKDTYLGDPSTTDWVMDGQAVIYQDTVLLTMAPNTVGTVLASSIYMWYGNVRARLRTSRGQGVVTAFILLSDVKDEIDYEFVGVELTTAQSNFYSQGIPDYNNAANISLSDTYANYHDYEIQWTPDTITWLVDGQVGRVKQRSDTWNSTSNSWNFPQTPARVQLSIWPGGLASNGQGTIDWAGGLIDWDSQDIQQYGYDYAQFEYVTVDCFNATSPPGTNTGVSYYYNNAAATNNTVVDGDKPTVLKSLLGTGTNMSAALPAGASSSSIATVPGNGNGTNPAGTQPQSNGTSSGGSQESPSPSDGSSGSTGTAAGSAPTGTGFSQGGGGSSLTKSAGSKLLIERGSNGLGGSVFAVIVAVAVLTLL